MASITEEQIPKTLKFLRQDYPDLLLKLGRIEDKDEYWEEVSRECNVLYKKYDNLFSKMLLLTLAEYLSMQDKMKKDKELNEILVRWRVKVR